MAPSLIRQGMVIFSVLDEYDDPHFLFYIFVACVASVSVRKNSSKTIFCKLAARKLGQETEGKLARRPPIFEKPVRGRTGFSKTGFSDWCGSVTMIDTVAMGKPCKNTLKSNQKDKMKLSAKFKKVLSGGFRATLIL